MTIAIVLATLVGAWMFRYEPIDRAVHRNRFTGVECFHDEECWIKDSLAGEPEKPASYTLEPASPDPSATGR